MPKGHVPRAAERGASSAHGPGVSRTFLRLTALSSLGLSEDLYEQRMSPSSSSHRLTHSPFFAWRYLRSARGVVLVRA